MPRIFAAIFLVTICFAPAFAMADDAANKQCPTGFYDANAAQGAVVNGKTNLYGQECADSMVRGYCRAADDCHAQTCLINGQWKDCPTSTTKVDASGTASGSTSDSPSVTSDTQNLTPMQQVNQGFQDVGTQQSTGGLTQQQMLQSVQGKSLLDQLLSPTPIQQQSGLQPSFGSPAFNSQYNLGSVTNLPSDISNNSFSLPADGISNQDRVNSASTFAPIGNPYSTVSNGGYVISNNSDGTQTVTAPTGTSDQAWADSLNVIAKNASSYGCEPSCFIVNDAQNKTASLFASSNGSFTGAAVMTVNPNAVGGLTMQSVVTGNANEQAIASSLQKGVDVTMPAGSVQKYNFTPQTAALVAPAIAEASNNDSSNIAGRAIAAWQGEAPVSVASSQQIKIQNVDLVASQDVPQPTPPETSAPTDASTQNISQPQPNVQQDISQSLSQNTSPSSASPEPSTVPSPAASPKVQQDTAHPENAASPVSQQPSAPSVGNPDAGGSAPAQNPSVNPFIALFSNLLGGLSGGANSSSQVSQSSQPAVSSNPIFVSPLTVNSNSVASKGYIQATPQITPDELTASSSALTPAAPFTQLLKLTTTQASAPANPVNTQNQNPQPTSIPPNPTPVPSVGAAHAIGAAAAQQQNQGNNAVSSSEHQGSGQNSVSIAQSQSATPVDIGGLQIPPVGNAHGGTGGSGNGTGNGIGSGSESGVQTFAQIESEQQSPAKNCTTMSCWANQQIHNVSAALQNPGKALADLVSISPANAQPYDAKSGQALADAVNTTCKVMQCNARLLQQAFGGVCGIESTCDSTQPHPGSQYQGFGQLGTNETYTAIRQLQKMAQSPQLSPQEQQQLQSVVQAATSLLQRGENPNANPLVGPWLLVALHASLGTPPSVSAATSDPHVAAAMLECAQFAPATCSGNFNLNSQLTPASARAYNAQGLGWYYPGMTVAEASQQLLSAAGHKFSQGITYATEFSPSASPAPIPSNYAGVGCIYRGCAINPTIQPGNPGYAQGIARVPHNPITGLWYQDAQTGAYGAPSAQVTREQFIQAAREDVALERLAQQGKLPQGAAFQNFTATQNGTANTPIPPRQIINGLSTNVQSQFGCSGTACNGKMIDYKNPQGLSYGLSQWIKERYANTPASNSTQMRAATIMADYIACTQLGGSCGSVSQANEDRSSGTERHPNGYAIDVKFANAKQQADYAAAYMAAAHSLGITPGMGFTASCDNGCIVHADTAGAQFGGTGWAYGGSCGNGSASCIPNISDQRVRAIAQVAANGQDVPDSLLPQSTQTLKTYTIKNQNGDTVAQGVPLPDGSVAPDGTVRLLADKDGNPLGTDGKGLGSGSSTPLLVSADSTLPKPMIDPNDQNKIAFADERPTQPQIVTTQRPYITTRPVGYPTGGNGSYGGQQYCLVSSEPIIAVPCGGSQMQAGPIAQPAQSYLQASGQVSSGVPIPATPVPLPNPTVTPPQPPRSALTLIANPTLVAVGGSTRIAWSSVGTWSCSVYAPGGFLIGTTTHGSALSFALATSSTFTALCLTSGSTTLSASTTVIVQ